MTSYTKPRVYAVSQNIAEILIIDLAGHIAKWARSICQKYPPILKSQIFFKFFWAKLVTHFNQVGTHAQKKRLARRRRISIPVYTSNIPFLYW